MQKLVRLLGPGLITGAADDDPSSVGTFAIAGAALGLATLWTALFTFPFLAATQIICARVGMVTGSGIAAVIRRRFPRILLYPAVAALLVANTITIGADLSAIADAIRIFVDIPIVWLVIPVTLALLAVQVFAGYRQLTAAFKGMSLALLAYVVDAFFVRGDFHAILRASVVPTLSLDRRALMTILAIVGTMLSPYIFFWQSSVEVEEEKAAGRHRIWQRRGARRIEMRYSAIDITAGMAVTVVIMYFTILSTALTLHATGHTELQSGADAAKALEPVAGRFAGLLFAAGMVGTGLLSVPVLSMSSAYALAEAFKWPRSIDAKWWEAKGFYAVIAAGMLAGAGLTLSGVNPIAALFWSSLVNGVVAPPLLAIVLVIARSPRVMGERRIGRGLAALGWITVAALTAGVVGLVVSYVGSHAA